MNKSSPTAFRRQILDLMDQGLSVSEVLSRVNFIEPSAYCWWRPERNGRGVIDDSDAIFLDRLLEAGRQIRELKGEVTTRGTAAAAL